MAAVVTGTGIAAAGVASPEQLLNGTGPAADPGFDPVALLGGRGLRYKDGATRLAMLAAKYALEGAALFDETGAVAESESFAVVVSSNLGNLDTVCQAAETIREQGVAGTSPMDLPNASSNVVASSIAIRFGLRGPNLMLCNGEASGLDAVHWAAVLIGSGRARRALVVGVETTNAYVRELAGEVFDGAAALVLEHPGSAAARRAPALARVGAYVRGTGTADSVQRALAGTPVGLVLSGAGQVTSPAGPDVRTCDLDTVVGPSSGARGVLQCALGAHWLGDGGHGGVLASAGHAADGVATLVLHGAGAAR
ncbi:beta-ketoacyl synthase N-terminal-like domain-containing protein [Streptomyces sp. NPDC052109]|uniref:beta-ketoacyl synthase N-terminal-like domain-containing protein n=1 Tax=Streptomyces sp. NPDC052109 TaxID=3155527 RepID=UPI003417D835